MTEQQICAVLDAVEGSDPRSTVIEDTDNGGYWLEGSHGRWFRSYDEVLSNYAAAGFDARIEFEAVLFA